MRVLRDEHGVYERFAMAAPTKVEHSCVLPNAFADTDEDTWRQLLIEHGGDAGKVQALPADQLQALGGLLMKIGIEPPAADPSQGGGMQQAQEPFAERIEVARVERFFETHRDQFERFGSTKESFVLGFRNLVRMHPGSTARNYCGDPAA